MRYSHLREGAGPQYNKLGASMGEIERYVTNFERYVTNCAEGVVG